MVWNYTDIAVLTMKQMSKQELKSYLTQDKRQRIICLQCLSN